MGGHILQVTTKLWGYDKCRPMHRLPISELITAAEAETAKARAAYDPEDRDSQEHLQRCLDVLEALRIMKERGVPDSLKDYTVH